MKIRTDANGELDELFAYNCSVHIERMDAREFWLEIKPKRGNAVHVRTGIERGKWYFRVDEEAIGGQNFVVERRAR